MRRVRIGLLAVLLTAACAAVVLTPAATAKGRPAVTITSITGYSDGSTGGGDCKFHVVITYTTAGHLRTLYAGYALYQGDSQISSAGGGTLDGSPANLGFVYAPNDVGDVVTLGGSNFNFIVQVTKAHGKQAWTAQSDNFTLSPGSYVNSCPAPGPLVSTDF